MLIEIAAEARQIAPAIPIGTPGLVFLEPAVHRAAGRLERRGWRQRWHRHGHREGRPLREGTKPRIRPRPAFRFITPPQVQLFPGWLFPCQVQFQLALLFLGGDLLAEELAQVRIFILQVTYQPVPGIDGIGRRHLGSLLRSLGRDRKPAPAVAYPRLSSAKKVIVFAAPVPHVIPAHQGQLAADVASEHLKARLRQQDCQGLRPRERLCRRLRHLYPWLTERHTGQLAPPVHHPHPPHDAEPRIVLLALQDQEGGERRHDLVVDRDGDDLVLQVGVAGRIGQAHLRAEGVHVGLRPEPRQELVLLLRQRQVHVVLAPEAVLVGNAGDDDLARPALDHAAEHQPGIAHHERAERRRI